MSTLPPDDARRAMKVADRRSRRLALRLPGTLRGRASWPVDVLDLSLGGCLVRGGARPEPGAILDLQFSLGVEAFSPKVRVREVSLDGATAEGGDARYLMGLEFLRLSASDHDLLLQYLEVEGRRRGSGKAPPR
jgi:hypothetical protein